MPKSNLVGLGPNAVPVLQEALHAEEKALQLQSGLPAALREKGKALESLKRPVEALAAWQELLTCQEAAVQDFTAAGDLAAQQRDSAAAGHIFKEAERRFLKDGSFHLMAGWAFLADPPAAVRAFAAARALIPADQKPQEELLVGAALAHWLNGQRDEAIADYRELITTKEKWSESIDGRNWSEAEKQLEAIRSATLSRYPELAPQLVDPSGRAARMDALKSD